MYYQNQAPTGSSYEYTNDTEQGKNLLITLSAGDGSITNAQWVESDWTKYWSTGARGVSAKAFIGEVLHEVAQGGLGNPQTIADQKIHTGYESYRCGRYWYGKPKYCSRATYGWSNRIRAKTRAGSGEVKSFVLNLEPNATLRIVFEGNANITNTLFNGSVSITEVPFTPLPPLVSPPAQEESPQENAPNDTDSQDSTQGQTDQTEQGEQTPQEGQVESTPQGGQNAESNTEQGQTEQDSQESEQGQDIATPPAQDSTESAPQDSQTQEDRAKQEALKALASRYAALFKDSLAYARANPSLVVNANGVNTTLQNHLIRIALRISGQQVEMGEAIALIEKQASFFDLYYIFARAQPDIYSNIAEESSPLISYDERQEITRLTLPQLESYGTSEGDLPNTQSPSEQAAPSPYTQVQLNAMRDIKTLLENASKNYATSPTLTCYSLADGRAIPFVHYMRDVAGLFHIRTLEELSEELLNSLSFTTANLCFNPVEKDTLPYPMEITQAINDLIDLDYQNNVFSMNYKEILAALGEQEGTIKIQN